MKPARAYGRDDRTITATGRTQAPPEVVFDLLSDLRSHLEWGGNRQYKMFRLKGLDAPSGQAEVGTVFTSVGKIPMTPEKTGHFEDTTTVTKAERPSLFEIRTEGRIPWKKGAPGEVTVIHRYDITPDGTGSRVVYTHHQMRFLNPPWGIRYPVMREGTYRMMIPAWLRKGFKNMLRMADDRARQTASR
jgi:uncharacterized protein YndB with AHSA1/START domain